MRLLNAITRLPRPTAAAILTGALVAAVAYLFLPTASAAGSGAHIVRSQASFGATAGAYTYAPDLVPVGASAEVQAIYRPQGTTMVQLRVRGLLPNRAYGAHAHVNPCGATGGVAGVHFQHTVDPVQPSTNPAYANPDNEIWLDFTTDSDGNAAAVTQVNWQFTDRRAASVVLHRDHTHTEPGTAGTAGPRLACLSVAF